MHDVRPTRRHLLTTAVGLSAAGGLAGVAGCSDDAAQRPDPVQMLVTRIVRQERRLLALAEATGREHPGLAATVRPVVG
ncbi:MAG: hypothetical protein ACRDYU_16705, partial [Actinomycetes bacterium]